MRLYAADMRADQGSHPEKLDIPLPQVKIEARMGDPGPQRPLRPRRAVGRWRRGHRQPGHAGRSRLHQPVGNTLLSGGIPASGLGTLPNPNLNVGTPGQGQILPVSSQTGLPTGTAISSTSRSAPILPGVITSGAAGIAFGIVGSRLNINLALASAERARARPARWRGPRSSPSRTTRPRSRSVRKIPYATVSSAGTQIQFKEAVLSSRSRRRVVRRGRHQSDQDDGRRREQLPRRDGRPPARAAVSPRPSTSARPRRRSSSRRASGW